MIIDAKGFRRDSKFDVISASSESEQKVTGGLDVDSLKIGGTPIGQLFASIQANDIVVESDGKAVVYTTSARTEYGSLKDALVATSGISDKVVKLSSDVSLDGSSPSSFDINPDSDTTFDLCGHTLTICGYEGSDRKYAFNLDGSTASDITAKPTKVTFRNGTVKTDHVSFMNIQNADVKFENLKVETNMRIDMDQKERTKLGISRLHVDRDSEIEFTYDPGIIADYDKYVSGIRLYGCPLSVCPSLSSHCTSMEQFWEKNPELISELTLDGKVTTKCDVDGKTFDVNSTTGSTQYITPRITVNRGAYLKAERGCGLFINNSGELNINGGTVIGTTGIVVRAGHVNIPVESDLIAVGTGDGNYDNGIESGSSTTTLNLVGNALLVDSVSSQGYGRTVFPDDIAGYHPPKLKIEAGTFRTTTREPIGSYAHVDSGDMFNPRVEKFMSGGYMDSYPSGDKYDSVNCTNPDYNLAADGFGETVPCQFVMN